MNPPHKSSKTKEHRKVYKARGQYFKARVNPTKRNARSILVKEIS